MQIDKTLELLTNSLQRNGIDYEVTFKQTDKGVNTSVRLIDMTTNSTLGITKGNTLEEALTDLVGKLLVTRGSTNDMLTIL